MYHGNEVGAFTSGFLTSCLIFLVLQSRFKFKVPDFNPRGAEND